MTKVATPSIIMLLSSIDTSITKLPNMQQLAAPDVVGTGRSPFRGLRLETPSSRSAVSARQFPISDLHRKKPHVVRAVHGKGKRAETLIKLELRTERKHAFGEWTVSCPAIGSPRYKSLQRQTQNDAEKFEQLDKLLQRETVSRLDGLGQPRYFGFPELFEYPLYQTTFRAIRFSALDCASLVREIQAGHALVFENTISGFRIEKGNGGLHFKSAHALLQALWEQSQGNSAAHSDVNRLSSFFRLVEHSPYSLVQFEACNNQDSLKAAHLKTCEEVAARILSVPGTLYIKDALGGGGFMVLKKSELPDGTVHIESDSPEYKQLVSELVATANNTGSPNTHQIVSHALSKMHIPMVESLIPFEPINGNRAEFRLVCMRTKADDGFEVVASYAKVSSNKVTANISHGGWGEKCIDVAEKIYRQRLPGLSQEEYSRRASSFHSRLHATGTTLANEFFRQFAGTCPEDFAIDLCPSWNLQKNEIDLYFIEWNGRNYGIKALWQSMPESASLVDELRHFFPSHKSSPFSSNHWRSFQEPIRHLHGSTIDVTELIKAEADLLGLELKEPTGKSRLFAAFGFEKCSSPGQITIPEDEYLHIRAGLGIEKAHLEMIDIQIKRAKNRAWDKGQIRQLADGVAGLFQPRYVAIEGMKLCTPHLHRISNIDFGPVLSACFEAAKTTTVIQFEFGAELIAIFWHDGDFRLNTNNSDAIAAWEKSAHIGNSRKRLRAFFKLLHNSDYEVSKISVARHDARVAFQYDHNFVRDLSRSILDYPGTLILKDGFSQRGSLILRKGRDSSGSVTISGSSRGYCTIAEQVSDLAKNAFRSLPRIERDIAQSANDPERSEPLKKLYQRLVRLKQVYSDGPWAILMNSLHSMHSLVIEEEISAERIAGRKVEILARVTGEARQSCEVSLDALIARDPETFDLTTNTESIDPLHALRQILASRLPMSSQSSREQALQSYVQDLRRVAFNLGQKFRQKLGEACTLDIVLSPVWDSTAGKLQPYLVGIKNQACIGDPHETVDMLFGQSIIDQFGEVLPAVRVLLQELYIRKKNEKENQS